ncbi:hypothetical protein BT93_B2076 [Corymbia citriodora subsp. variegata]|nr:hypothetical protein BT93_B2076 [Corymbia citriodora subsp. variegata]
MALDFIPPSVRPMAPAKPAVKPAVSQSRAYVTFMAGKGDSVKGVVGLVKGLRNAKSTYRLVVAVLPDVPEDHRRILEEQGCRVREIKLVCPPGNQTPFAMADYFINYSKLRIWEFVEYDKMIYLDGDMQVHDNIDHLFDMEDGYFYAVLDCFCERTWSHTPQYAIGYCQQCPDKVPWRDEMGPRPSPYFNDGMFVFEPSRTTYEGLMHTFQGTPPTPFAQQDFLNTYFRPIYRPLPLTYNFGTSMLWRHPEEVELEKVKVVQYCAAGSKPWMCSGQEDADNMQREGLKMQVKKLWDFAVKEDIKMLVQKWRDIYEDESLDYKNWIWRPRKRPSRSTGSLGSGPNKRSAK